MVNRLLRSQMSPSLRYAVVGAFVLALFAGGFLIGSALDAILQPSSNPASTGDARPAGGAIVNPPYRVQDFTLTSHAGEPLSLSDLRGQAVLMFFGYTHCPDVCPLTLADYTRVKQALGSDADAVAFVFISVDGERDTPDVVAEYLGRYDADFIGMTGDVETLRRIGREYGLVFERTTAETGLEADERHLHGDDLDSGNYFVNHTSPSFLIDRDGYLRMVYFYGTAPEAIAEGIRGILQP